MAFHYTSPKAGRPDAETTPAHARRIAEDILGPVEWTDETSGYCRCPGVELHTSPTRDHDCRVSLDQDDGHVPTVFCFHSSCLAVIEEANRSLRSALGKARWGRQNHQNHFAGSGGSGATAPVITDANAFETLLRSAFEADDIVSIAPAAVPEEGGKAVPEHGGVNIFTRDQWLEKVASKGGIGRVFGGREGLYIRINPLTPKAHGGDKDVAKRRHVLIESDSLPKPEQERILRASGLPIAALIDSGGSSIHAWVRVNAKNVAEYHERREKIWKSVESLQIDPQNRNPSRFSRCPGAQRGSSMQRLLAVNLGPATYEAWAAVATADALPGIVAADACCAEDEPDPPLLIDGLLFKGSKMIIAGPSKARKTWNLTDLAVCLSVGQPWCGFTTRRSKVLYVNLALQSFSYRKRIRWICEKKGIATAELGGFHLWNLRGHATEVTRLVGDILRHVKDAAYDLIIVDPIYKTYGDREENSNTDMGQVMNELEGLARLAKVAVVIAAHFPKGNLAARDAIDRVAGAAVFGRDPDVLLVMTPHEEPDAFTITPILRDLPGMGEFVIRWGEQCFQRIAADPKAVAGREDEKGRKRERAFTPGSYREMFSEMPPLRNDRDPEKSEVLAHIAAELEASGKDPASAQKVFDNIRQPKRRILVFDQESKRWRGIHYKPSEEERRTAAEP